MAISPVGSHHLAIGGGIGSTDAATACIPLYPSFLPLPSMFPARMTTVVRRRVVMRTVVRRTALSSPPHGPSYLSAPSRLMREGVLAIQTPKSELYCPFVVILLPPPTTPPPMDPPLPHCLVIHNLPAPPPTPPPPSSSPVLLISCQPSGNFGNDEFSSPLF